MTCLSLPESSLLPEPERTSRAWGARLQALVTRRQGLAPRGLRPHRRKDGLDWDFPGWPVPAQGVREPDTQVAIPLGGDPWLEMNRPSKWHTKLHQTILASSHIAELSPRPQSPLLRSPCFTQNPLWPPLGGRGSELLEVLARTRLGTHLPLPLTSTSLRAGGQRFRTGSKHALSHAKCCG